MPSTVTKNDDDGMAPIRRILVGYDGFDRGEGVSAAAIELARKHGAEVHVLNVAPAEPRRPWRTSKVSSAELHASLVESRLHRIERMLQEMEEPEVSMQAHVRSGVPHIEIIRQASSIDADLIVVTDEPQRRDGRRGFGTVTAKLLRKSPVPVLAHRNHREWNPGRIVAALDVEPTSEDDGELNLKILDMAAMLARASAAKLVVFHAWSLWGEDLLRGRMDEEELGNLLKTTEDLRMREVDRLMANTDLSGLEVHVDVRKGEPRLLLPEMSAVGLMDILVMGTLCRTGLPGFIIGNTAERVLNKLTCAVVAVKRPDFVTPVDLSNAGAQSASPKASSSS